METGLGSSCLSRDESGALLDLALQASGAGHWAWNRGARHGYWSDEVYHMFGHRPDGRPVSRDAWRDAVHPDDLGLTLELFSAAFVERRDFVAEYRIRRPDGAVRWIRSWGRVVTRAAGAPRMVGVSLDVTAQKLQGEKLRARPLNEILGKTDHDLIDAATADVFRKNDLEVLRSERQKTEETLRAANRRKDEFLAMLSHELRNPLSTIRNAVSVLRCSRTESPRIERLHDMIDRQSEQLARMVDDLLDVGRISQGKLILRKERVELGPVVSRAVETSRPLIDAGGHTLSIKMPAAPVTLEGDLGRLSQVLSNLLNNAAKYTERCGSIRLSADVEGDEVTLRVEDNGMGIAPEVLPHVFDLFTQSSRAIDRAQGGLGIGLTLVRTLVEMHGGRVSARSGGPGQGAEFTVRLPICPAASTEAPAPTLAPLDISPSIERRRILVVDDNIDAAESLALMLGYLGHETIVAHDGPSTLEAAAAFQPELVLLDIGLPGLDGYEVARRLRAERTLRGAILVALTGYGQEEDRRRARRAGFDHHLTKPVDHDRLITLIASLVAPASLPS